MKKNTLTLLIVMLATMACPLLGCTDADASGLEIKSSAVSDCGGFRTSDMALTDESAQSDYCDAEVLKWWYDEETETLSLLNARVFLNCCGEHGFATRMADNGTYIVTETDKPLKGGGRCGCMCVFDYEISLEDIPAQEISLKLGRDVKDGESSTVWKGTLDLTGSNSDTIIIEEGGGDGLCESL